MSKYIAAIDQGTTSTRFLVFDKLGNLIAGDQIEHQQIFPQPGWVEHDALEIWQNTQKIIQNVLSSGKIKKDEILAVGITNQRETTVVWDKNTGEPICNAIVWQDTRTDKICNEYDKEYGAEYFQEKTGLPISVYFSGPKIKWILDNVEGARELANDGQLLFGNIDSWLVWNLTGEHITDVTNASRTMLMDIGKLAWSEELLTVLDIPISMLPTIRSSSEVYGVATGVLEGIPVAGILGDQQAALFGQACFDIGEAKNTYGTGCFLLLNTGEKLFKSNAGLLTTVGYKLGDQPAVYALEGSVAITGALVQWLRDNLGIIQSADEIEALAQSVEDNGGIYFVPAFSGLFAPYWRSDARGVIVGMSRHTNKAHLARAVLEATAYQTKEVVAAMVADSGAPLAQLKVDGGMVANQLLMQFQSDILGVPVIRPKVAETTALGAAYAAGLAVGYWENLDDLRSNWQMSAEWHPNMEEEVRQKLFAGWKKAVTRSFDWI